MRGKNSEKPFLQKLEHLAFGRSNDAVKLAFLGEDALEKIDELDLSTLTELHRLSNGTVELKFLDRVKLFELLEQAGEKSREAGAADLVSAINSAADRLPPAPEAQTGDPDADS